MMPVRCRLPRLLNYGAAHIYLTITFLTESVRQTFKKNCSEYLSEKVGQTLSRVSRLKAKENKTGF